MEKENIHFRSLTDEKLNLAIKGDLSLYDGEELIPLKLTENDFLVFEKAKEDGFIRQKKIDRYGTWKKTTTAFFYWCEIYKRIFILISERSKYSDIHIDFRTASSGYGRRNERSNVFSEIDKFAQDNGYFWNRDSIRDVPNSQVDFVVSALLKIISLDGKVQEPFYEPDVRLEEKRRQKLHYRVERNPELAKKAKEIHGYICQVCGFDFEKEYGELGENYIEAHHIVPLSQHPENISVHLSPKDDFAVLCANCHRMIHRNGAPENFETFRELYKGIHK